LKGPGRAFRRQKSGEMTRRNNPFKNDPTVNIRRENVIPRRRLRKRRAIRVPRNPVSMRTRCAGRATDNVLFEKARKKISTNLNMDTFWEGGGGPVVRCEKEGPKRHSIHDLVR